MTTSADTLRRIRGHISNLASPDDATALQAEYCLIRFGRKALELLVAAAAHEDPRVRFRAVWALGKSRDRRALPTILELTQDADARVAYDAVLALGELGDLGAVPRLAELSGQAEDDRGLVGASWSALRKLGRVIAERIETGTADPETSRALVVFNVTHERLSGTAIFHAEMSWPLGTPLPPVVVMEMDGTPVASALTDQNEGPDLKGRAERRHLSFDLRFAVQAVPARGWKTYLAAYAERVLPVVENALTETPGLIVVETLRHGGDLPAAGTFADWFPSMVQ